MMEVMLHAARDPEPGVLELPNIDSARAPVDHGSDQECQKSHMGAGWCAETSGKWRLGGIRFAVSLIAAPM